MEPFLDLLGRLHPVAVHLPIGIFLLLALVELAGLFPRGPRLSDAQRTFVLVLGLAVALATALFGWLLAREGGYDAVLLDRHQRLGFLFAALAAGMLVAHLRGWRRSYGILLVASVVALSIAGHFGGTLTHGENYLTASFAPAEKPKAKLTAPDQAVVFANVIHPILEQRCASCHGATKSNGDLRYDTFEQLLKGGKSGPSFVAGNAAASRMIQRVHLPLDAKEHMPPKGKPQLADDETEILEWWIDAGAPSDRRLAELSPPPIVAEKIAERLGFPAPPPPDRTKTLAAAQALERKLGIVIRPLTIHDPWLSANARLQEGKFGDAQLAELAAIAPALHWLDVGETAVTDAGLASLAEMKNLRRLHLDRTAITDAGLAKLTPLARLELLNLHATKTTDAGLDALRGLPRLRSLYLWQTKMTPEAVEKFGEQQTDTRKIARWRQEIAALETQIRGEHFSANLGASLPQTKDAKMDSKTEKAGKTGKTKKTGETEKTEQTEPAEATEPEAKDAAPAPAKPAPAAPAQPPVAAAPVNERCLVSDENVDASVTTTVDGKLVAFCCEGCREEFLAEPAKFPLPAAKK